MFISPSPGQGQQYQRASQQHSQGLDSSISPHSPSTYHSHASSNRSGVELDYLAAGSHPSHTHAHGHAQSHHAHGQPHASSSTASIVPLPDSPGRSAKKIRLRRSRLACLECRERKSKCNALPPDPCSTCIARETTCHWPMEDRRSTRIKRKRVHSSKSELDEDTATGSGTGTGKDAFPERMWWHGTKSSKATAAVSAQISPLGPAGAPPPPPPVEKIETTDSTLLDLLQLQPTRHNPPPTDHSHQHPSSDFRHPQPHPHGEIPPAGDTSTNMTADWLWALSTQMPLVFEDVLNTQPTVHPHRASGSSEYNNQIMHHAPDELPRLVRITWYRPHGQTAIVPGLKRITLKVRVSKANEHGLGPHAGSSALRMGYKPQEGLDLSDGVPPSVIKHLLEVFERHFGCQYPFFDRQELEKQVETNTASLFMLYSIAAMAARFSNHPAIALPHLEPWAYGNVFYDRAKAMLGSMLAVPSRETTFSILLLANLGYANDSEAELWNLTGLAVRMSIDLALHLSPPEDSTISAEERRLNRLLFWAVLILDHSIAHGTGRQTAFPLEDITQTVPTQEDIVPGWTPGNGIRSPFPYTSKLMLLYGPIINSMNRQKRHPSRGLSMVEAAQATALREYNQLPGDMQWNVTNLQKHIRVNQGPIFIHLHLWVHTILTTAYLASTLKPLKSTISTLDGSVNTSSGTSTPNSITASHLWRNSVRIIEDVLAFSDIFDPFAYCALPHVTQSFYAAGCCYAAEMEENKDAAATSSSVVPDSTENRNLSRAILTTVSSNQISALRQGLNKMATYWSGVAWIEATLGKRIEGVQDVDLVDVTEKLKSFVSLPDEGLARKRSNQVHDSSGNGTSAPHGHGHEHDRRMLSTSWGNGLAESSSGAGGGGGTSWAQDLAGLPFGLDFSTLEVEGLEEHDIPVPQFM